MKKSKGGQLALNEWDFDPESEPKLDLTPGFTHYEISVIGIIDIRIARKITNNKDFFSNFKQYFAIKETDLKETDNNRYMLEMTVLQAVSTAG